jgi:phospholipid/cholesterol/gamma-HCH transport system substrate-binding protein
MKRMSRRSRDAVVGAGALAGLIVFVVWGFSAGGAASGGGYDITARFSRVDGLTIGSEVRLVGVPVGEVSALRLDNESGMAYLTFTIDSNIGLPTDTTALILSETVLSGKHVKLDAGGALEMMSAGDAIEYVQDSVIIEGILERIVRAAEHRREKRKAGGSQQ